MKNIKKILIIGLILSGFSFLVYTQNQSITLQSLVEEPDKYNQKMVFLQAEAIGEPLTTDTGIWLNLGSDGYNVAVFLEEKEMLKKINYWGSYKEKGDIVRVKGIFYKNCPIHNQRGIHLVDLSIEKQGEEREHKTSRQKRRIGVISLIICLTIGIIYFIKVKLWQKK